MHRIYRGFPLLTTTNSLVILSFWPEKLRMSRARASFLLKNVRMSRVGTHLRRSGGHKGNKDDNEPQEPNIRRIRRIMGPVPRIIRILGMFMTCVGHMRQEPRIHDPTCFTYVCGSRIRRTLNIFRKSWFYKGQRMFLKIVVLRWPERNLSEPNAPARKIF